MFKDLFPAGTTFTNDNQEDSRASTSSVGGRFGTGIGNVAHGAIGEIPVASLPSPLCLEGQTTVYYSTYASINFAPLCYTSFLTQPYFMRVDASVIVRLESFVSGSCIGIWRWDATGTFPLESTCISDPKRHCDPSYTDPFRFLDLPLEVTADGETTSFGDYDSESTDPHSYMPLRDTAASIGESIRDALTATFRITSRSSCQTPEPRPCDINSDCTFYVVSVDGYDNEDCGAEYLYAWFDNEEDAEEYALQYAGNGFCGTVIIDLTLGACCDLVEGDVVIRKGCFPGPGELPFFTNLEPQELACP